MGLRSGGASSGCGSAGSLWLVGAVRVGEVTAGCCEAGPASGWGLALWVRCHFLMVLARRLAVRDVRFGVKCGVDLDSPGKRGLDCSEGRRGVLSSAQGLVEDRVEGGCDVPRRGRYGCSWGWLLRLYPSGSLSLVGGVVRWRLRSEVCCGAFVVGLEYPPRRGSGELGVWLVGR